jgi:hypothetical protein
VDADTSRRSATWTPVSLVESARRSEADALVVGSGIATPPPGRQEHMSRAGKTRGQLTSAQVSERGATP